MIRSLNHIYYISHDIKHGSVIKLSNREDHSQAGDINLIVNQDNHPRFRRSKNGKDLLMIEKISLYFSLGCETFEKSQEKKEKTFEKSQEKKERTIIVHTISNKTLKITITDGVIIKPGNVIKICNEGIRGHLYIVFEVVFPDVIPEKELLLFRDMLTSSELAFRCKSPRMQPLSLNSQETEDQSSLKNDKVGNQGDTSENAEKIFPSMSDSYKGKRATPPDKDYKNDQKERCLKFDGELNYSDIEPIKISDIYSSFPINKKIKIDEFKDDDKSSEDFTSDNCSIM